MLTLNSIVVVYVMKKIHVRFNNMPDNRHKNEIGKYENFIQIQPQTSYSKWQQYKHDLPIHKCKHKVDQTCQFDLVLE